ncbi:MAG TPA: ATP-binding protein, partial [Planctomycetota bacterium]|nr:ATP-binding protein [Planctomycetota bacterium]
MHACNILILDENSYLKQYYTAPAFNITEIPFQFTLVSSKREVLEKLTTGTFTILLLSLQEQIDTICPFIEQLFPCSIPKILFWDDSDYSVLLYFLAHNIFATPKKKINIAELIELIRCAQETYENTEELHLLSCTEQWIECIIPSKKYYLPRVSQWFIRFLDFLEQKELHKIMYAFRELLQNAIEHGNKYEPTKRIRIRLNMTPNSLLFYIQDEGEGFDLQNLPHALIGKSKNETMDVMMYRRQQGMRLGGLGIASVFAIADEVIYNQLGNSVLMIKYLPIDPNEN